MKPRTGYQIVKDRTTAALRHELTADHKSEYRLHAAIVDLLASAHLPGVTWFHCPSGMKASAKAAAVMKPLGFIAGVSDLCISVPGGRMCFLEIKTRSGRLSEAQEAFLAGMDHAGHRTAVVRSLDEAAMVLRDWGAIKAVRVAA